MNMNLLIRNEVKNNKQRYTTVYDLMDDMINRFPQAQASERGNDGTMKNSTLRREIARELDASPNWTPCGRTQSGRKLYERVETNDLGEFVCK